VELVELRGFVDGMKWNVASAGKIEGDKKG